VCLGYWSDPLLPLMVKRGERRAPEINLGYYARVMGVRLLIHKFFEACDTTVQILNLGAGFDTLFWRLVAEGRPLKNFVEVDFSGVTARKCYLIKRHRELLREEGLTRTIPALRRCLSYFFLGIFINEYSDPVWERIALESETVGILVSGFVF
jgi:[phosphatase 2A protein]-leucine-carboxy methyltransferase